MREELRMKLWCDVYAVSVDATMRNPGYTTSSWGDIANGAVELFDKAFPEPTPAPNLPPPPSRVI